jgi:hypothetical protein
LRESISEVEPTPPPRGNRWTTILILALAGGFLFLASSAVGLAVVYPLLLPNNAKCPLCGKEFRISEQ